MNGRSSIFKNTASFLCRYLNLTPESAESLNGVVAMNMESVIIKLTTIKGVDQ